MPEDRSSAISRNALLILAVIASGAALYWLRGILTPLALAMFLAVMIDGFARILRARTRRLVPDEAAMPVAIILSIALFGGAAFVVADNATAFAGQLVSYTPRLNGLIARVAGLAGVDVPPTIDQLFQQLNPTRYLGDVAKMLQDFASNAVFILIYLGFIIASRRGFGRKVVGLFPQREERQYAVDAFHRIRDGVEQYLWVQTVTGLMIALGSWAVMAAVGLDNALFWAFLIFIASYIPVVGGLVGILAPPLFALVQFDTYWQAIVLVAVLQTLQFVVGNVVLPRMQGRSLNIDPVVVLLSLAFWGAIWGVAGMFLSTPLTVMLMVILAQFPGTRWVAVLLSADGEPDRLKDSRPVESPDQPIEPKPRRKSVKRE
ncbi:AI-2E family transporter [Phenylobacterium sp.]|jgi:predicted PurR-regulated permease PerM|uniref:AI-2E family transporter n=1 Tax=Phenylobacterium sp. TaxID=1871053 RepID=UPI002F42FF03